MRANHQTVRLSAGRHRTPDDGVCVMELASMLADEPFTDHPASVSPVLASALRGYNDGLDDDRRQTLKRFAALAVGTASTGPAEKERRRLISAWLAQEDADRGWLAPLNRRLDAAEPSKRTRELGKRVALQGDDALHNRTLRLLEAMAAVGQPAESGLCAPAPDPCSHHCDETPAGRTLEP